MIINNNEIRQFNNVEEVAAVLQKKLDNHFQITSHEEIPSPMLLKNMDKALKLFFEAIKEHKKIVIITDSDMDGLGTFLVQWKFFEEIYNYDNVEIHITNRNEGYGFLPIHVDRYPADLYITSDNGITASEAIEAADKINAKVIITDHHQIDPEKWPLYTKEEMFTVIDPWIPGDEYPDKTISGSLVTWLFYKAIANKLDIKKDVYHNFLAEMAITTISDVMPIDRGFSRFVVKDFLVNKKFNNSDRQYIKSFLELKNNQPNAEDIAFAFVPMMNATQRITTAEHAASYLLADEEKLSHEWLNYISQLNEIRKERQQALMSYIEKNYKEYLPNATNNLKIIIIPGKFHDQYKGVLGIIAGRLAEKYRVPAVVMNYSESKDLYSGSGRSVGDINILDLFRNEDLKPAIHHLGGHKQALGIGIHKEQFDMFYNKLKELSSLIPEDKFLPIVKTSGYIDLKDLNIDWYKRLEDFEPFGHMFPRPNFISEVIITKVTKIGKMKNHMIVEVRDTNKNLIFKGLWFFHEFEPVVNNKYYMVYKLDIDSYKGSESLSLRVINMYTDDTFNKINIDNAYKEEEFIIGQQ